MVEVFKTTVNKQSAAKELLDCLHSKFAGYQANFDLKDCDCILRVESDNDYVAADEVICIVEKAGFMAEILPDIIVDF